MLDVAFRKMSRFVTLSEEEQQLFRAHAQRLQRFPAHADIIQDGNEPRFLNLVIDGWACRYKQLQDGRRQILAVFVPGDMCDPCIFLLDRLSHALATLTPATILRIAEKDVADLMRTSATLTRAFWTEMLVTAEVQREWTVSLGRRSAMERMAHLFCELFVRLRAVGLADAHGCDLPLTQADLGDMLGLSSVHVNRTLQEMRSLKLIELRTRRLIVRNEAAMQAIGLFNPDYLHLRQLAEEKRPLFMPDADSTARLAAEKPASRSPTP